MDKYTLAGPGAIFNIPCTITKPGDYYFDRDLTWSGDIWPAIGVSATAADTGPVIIDLNGHTLSGGNSYVYASGGISVSTNNNPVTVKNGTITRYSGLIGTSSSTGLIIFSNLNLVTAHLPPGYYGSGYGMTINNSNVIVTNCVFSDADVGISIRNPGSLKENTVSNLKWYYI